MSVTLADMPQSAEMFVVYGLAVAGIYFLLTSAERAWRRWNYGPRTWNGSRKGYSRPNEPLRRASAEEQLGVVMRAQFSQKPVMSKLEYGIFRVVENEVQASLKGFRVFAQTSLGEVLNGGDKAAHSTINSKRVDVLVISPSGMPVLAVEYQGKGHYQNDAAARDAVKKEALRKAGVAYLEITDTHTPQQIRRLVREVFGLPVASTMAAE
jgi:very-short-patch-repair endonuclease